MKRSFIREILENTSSETISFAGGLPDAKLFPRDSLEYSAIKAMNDVNSLQYSTSCGYDKLKEKIAKMYCDAGFKTNSSNIIITSGSQQALDIISRFYKDKSISLEVPSYLGAMNVFNLNNISMESSLLNYDGISIYEFEKSFKNTKLAYLIPDFQNPTGYTYSDEKRKKIALIVKQNDGILIEDAPYSQLYFLKENKSISSFIPNNSFHLGSFSKILAPSLRIGWIRADEKLLEPLVAYKEAMDLHTNGLAQHILNNYLENEKNFSKHKAMLRRVYKFKMRIFSSYLDELLPEFNYKKPQGGMFIYGKLEGVDTKYLVYECLKQGVVFVPGGEFYNNNIINNEIRFNFTNCSATQIFKGLRIIRNVIKELECLAS